MRDSNPPRPDTDAAALVERGRELLGRRRTLAARQCFNRALRLGVDPVAVGGERWTAAMLEGDFDAAWRLSDEILRRTPRDGFNRLDRPFHLRAVWDGRALEDRHVLVRCHHGLGDVVQFARFLPALAERARSLTVTAPDAAHAWLRAGVRGLCALHPLTAPDPPYDVDIELMELPFAFRTTLETIPPPLAPLANADAPRLPDGVSGAPLSVGLAWAAGAWDGGHRSPPSSAFDALATVAGVRWIGLQQGPARDHRPSGVRFAEVRPCGERMTDTAARMLRLDLIVSVDTMVAHLGASVGRPVWTLLAHAADWRWMLDRRDSPWYPAMRLFRQPEPGDWPSVLRRVADELRMLASAGDRADVAARVRTPAPVPENGRPRWTTFPTADAGRRSPP